MSDPVKRYSPVAVALVAGLGLISGLAILRFRFKPPKPPKGG